MITNLISVSALYSTRPQKQLHLILGFLSQLRASPDPCGRGGWGWQSWPLVTASSSGPWLSPLTGHYCGPHARPLQGQVLLSCFCTPLGGRGAPVSVLWGSGRMLSLHLGNEAQPPWECGPLTSPSPGWGGRGPTGLRFFCPLSPYQPSCGARMPRSG